MRSRGMLPEKCPRPRAESRHFPGNKVTGTCPGITAASSTRRLAVVAGVDVDGDHVADAIHCEGAEPGGMLAEVYPGVARLRSIWKRGPAPAVTAGSRPVAWGSSCPA